MFLQSQHIVLQQFPIWHNWILSIRQILDFGKSVDAIGFSRIPTLSSVLHKPFSVLQCVSVELLVMKLK